MMDWDNLFDGEWGMEEEAFLFCTMLTCDQCGNMVWEEELPYINGMYDYTCDCGGIYS